MVEDSIVLSSYGFGFVCAKNAWLIRINNEERCLHVINYMFSFSLIDLEFWILYCVTYS